MERVTAEFRKLCRQDVCSLLDMLEMSMPHLEGISEHLTIAWQREQPNLRHHHNHYVDLLLAVYLAKHAAFTENLVNSLNRFDYIGYALNARSVVESCSTLRYYLNTKYLPAFQGDSVNLVEVLRAHEQHLQGTRFDWEKFVSGRFQEMAADVRETYGKSDGAKLNESAKRIRNAQVNVLTCIKGWAREAPVVMILYELLCEMVHPNLGSTFLVASIKNGTLYFGRKAGMPAAHSLFETTIGWLLPVGYKEFGKLIGALASTKYPQDELGD